MTVTNIPPTWFSGRSVIRTDLTVLNAQTLENDLRRVLPQHSHNRGQIRQLQEYMKGWHPTIQAREKTTRTDVDNKVTVSYASAITREIVGYFLGKPIQYTNRRGTYPKQMESFNGIMHAENKALVDYQIAEDCSVCGIGYRGLFTEKTPRNGTHLRLLRLDPMDTFVVYPSDPTKPPVYAVTSYVTSDDGTMLPGASVSKTVYYKVYTADTMYLYKDETNNGFDAVTGGDPKLVDSKSINFGGGLPIVEYQNNLWRMGDWEMAISLMDAIDAVTSDGLNDIQQAVNSVLVAMGMKLTQDDFDNLSAMGFLNVSDIPPGVNPVVEFINQAMDAQVGIAMRDYLESTLRAVVGVPDRKTRSGGGGDTGDAVFMRDGWQDIDLVASSKEQYFIQAERQALDVMLYILDTYKEVKNIKAVDIDIHFNRTKTANLQSKAQVFQILRGTPDYPGLAPEDALDIAGLTNNLYDVIMRMNDYAEDMRKKRIEDANLSTADSNSDEGGSVPVGDEGGTE